MLFAKTIFKSIPLLLHNAKRIKISNFFIDHYRPARFHKLGCVFIKSYQQCISESHNQEIQLDCSFSIDFPIPLIFYTLYYPHIVNNKFEYEVIILDILYIKLKIII